MNGFLCYMHQKKIDRFAIFLSFKLFRQSGLRSRLLSEVWIIIFSFDFFFKLAFYGSSWLKGKKKKKQDQARQPVCESGVRVRPTPCRSPWQPVCPSLRCRQPRWCWSAVIYGMHSKDTTLIRKRWHRREQMLNEEVRQRFAALFRLAWIFVDTKIQNHRWGIRRKRVKAFIMLCFFYFQTNFSFFFVFFASGL